MVRVLALCGKWKVATEKGESGKRQAFFHCPEQLRLPPRLPAVVAANLKN
jgi:hypothetical protein